MPHEVSFKTRKGKDMEIEEYYRRERGHCQSYIPERLQRKGSILNYSYFQKCPNIKNGFHNNLNYPYIGEKLTSREFIVQASILNYNYFYKQFQLFLCHCNKMNFKKE